MGFNDSIWRVNVVDPMKAAPIYGHLNCADINSLAEYERSSKSFRDTSRVPAPFSVTII
jgi:hypothetical protein